MELSRGATIALLGMVLLSTTVAVGAATAPSRDISGASASSTMALPGQPQTLVGMQGTWAKQGSVYQLGGNVSTWETNADPDSETYADSYFDVTQLDNGTILAAFIDSGYRECGEYAVPCDRTGYRIIDPNASSGPELLSEYSFPVRSATNSEVHDVERVGPDQFVMTDMDRERVLEVRNSTVSWQWNASSFYDVPPDPTRRDWLHINDIDVIDEGRYLVSVRNANQLLVVERGQGVVEVINEDDDSSDASCNKGESQLADFDGDGDIRCGDPSVINHQHNPQWLGNGAVLVADSDNDRIVELHRTDDDWEPVWTLETAGGQSLHWPRDADRLPNGHTLVTDTLNNRLFEVDSAGVVVWGVGTDNLPYEAERVPFGEIAGGSGASADILLPQASGNQSITDTGGDGIPALTTAVVALRGQFSWMPFWFDEFHLLLTFLSFGLILGGGVDHWHTATDRSVRSSLSRRFDR